MAWTQMIVPEIVQDENGDPASGYVLKAYEPGTTTPTSIAITNAGGSLQSTLTTNAEGKYEVSGNDELPFIDRTHKWAIFTNATDASNNTNPYMGFYDNVDPFEDGARRISDASLDTYVELRALDPDAYTVGDVVYMSGDGIAGEFRVTTGSATDNGGTIITDATWNAAGKHWVRITDFVTPDMFGVKDDADYTTEMQAFLDYIRDTGVPGKGSGDTYRCDTAITLLSNSSSPKNYIIDWAGSLVDFSNSVATTGDFFQFGATSQSNGHDTEMIRMSNLNMLGPETGSPFAGDTPAGTTVGLSLEFCFNAKLDNIYIQGFYIGLDTNFVFPIEYNRMELKSNYIGVYLEEDTTEAQWNNLSVTSARYAIVIRPGSTGIVTGQAFYKPRIENCQAGIVLAPDDTSAGVAIRDIKFDTPYFESITYDVYRMGLVWTFANPQTRAANAAGDIIWCRSLGGVWGTGSWTATRAPLVLNSTATVLDGYFEVGADVSEVIGDTTESTVASLYDVSVGSSSKFEEYSNRVTQRLKQHNFSAFRNAQIANATGDGSVVLVICDTEDFDVGANYNTTTGIFTADIEGKYWLNAKVGLAGLLAGHTLAYIRIVTTDKTVLKSIDPGASADSNGEFVFELSDVFYLDAADTASITIQVSNSTKVVDINSNETRFSGYFLG